MKTSFAHISIVADDWKLLADFYVKVLGFTPIKPERDLSGKWLEKATGVENAKIRGIHLRLPGFEESGPTLEIFQYGEIIKRSKPALNRQGFSHIAIKVSNVSKFSEAITENGGNIIGELTSVSIPGAGNIEFQYTADPEGNIIELQKWE